MKAKLVNKMIVSAIIALLIILLAACVGSQEASATVPARQPFFRNSVFQQLSEQKWSREAHRTAKTPDLHPKTEFLA